VAERSGDYFDLAGASPFMLVACPVRREMRATIPGVVHVDGSARPQTVTRAENAPIHDLLLAFERRAGVPVLINTSFNTAHEPVVCTPENAIDTFLAAGLDVLVLEDLLVERVDR
jgi:carbamoyltransferase